MSCGQRTVYPPPPANNCMLGGMVWCSKYHRAWRPVRHRLELRTLPVPCKAACLSTSDIHGRSEHGGGGSGLLFLQIGRILSSLRVQVTSTPFQAPLIFVHRQVLHAFLFMGQVCGKGLVNRTGPCNLLLLRPGQHYFLEEVGCVGYCQQKKNHLTEALRATKFPSPDPWYHL